MIRFKNLLSLSLLVVVVSNITALARPNAGYNGYRQKLLKTTGGCKPAEASIDLDINNVRARLMTGGDMWWDNGTGEARYEVPKGSKKNSLFAGSLWVGGYDAQKQLKVAAQTYRQDGNDYWPGPLDVNAGGTITAATCSDWDKFWKVNKSDIIAFVEMKRANPSAPVTDPRYESILKWPAKGNIYATGTSGNNLGLASTYLSNTYANFVDVDNDGKYDATKGDYPKIDGDQYIWWVFNDAGNSKQQSNTDAIKLEIQASAFAFTTKDAMNDATFYNYRMWNRGNLTLDSTFVSTWTDADLGWFQDDYIGCDTIRGLGILYNSKTVDGDGQVNSYGSKAPMVGVDFFVGPIKKFKSPITGLDTSRKLSMEAFTYYNNDNSPNLGNPANGIQIYNYMTGSMRNGTRFHNDYIPGTTCVPANGTGAGPDTKFLFTGDLGKVEWTECNCCNATGGYAGDRRFIHSSGPFVLEPGTSNDITIGVVWTADVSGCPTANFRKIRAADDLAQGLFDNGFKVVEGPEAPRLVIREMDKKLIMYLVNDSISNNFGEKFGYDTNAKYRVASGRAKAIKAADSLYKFEGYRVFQVKYPTTTAADIINSKGEVNTDVAQEVFQCDIKNGISTIINYDKNIEVSDTSWSAITKVKGANQGISHSFEITQDAFASGQSKSLVNYRNYYFVAVAYAHNQFAAFDPNPKRIDSTQTIVYLESAKGAGGISIPVVSAMPNPANGDMGTVLNASYGSGVIIKRIEGTGNGGNAIDLSDASEAEALNFGKANNLVYKPGAGPINVKVVDPLKLKKADWELYITGRSYADTNRGIIPDSGSWRLVDITNNVTIYSERNMAKLNEQILEQYGLSVNITQTLRPNDEQDQGNGYITSDVTFEDPTKPWLAGVNDGEQSSMFNWIRSGKSIDNKQCFSDNKYDTLDQVYEKMFSNNLNTKGTWAPYSLGAYDGITDSCGLNMVKRSSMRSLNDLQSVDLVFTADKSKWTRCLVLEMQPKASLADGRIQKLAPTGVSDLRSKRSLYIDNQGNPFYSSDPSDTAMSWFPGYAINQETGERLNIVFTEDSYQKSENGADLIYNPTATTLDDFGNPIFGGRHFVYILSSKYDSCKAFKNELTNNPVPALSFRAYNKFMWTGATMLNQGYKLKSFKDGIIPTTTRLRFRVRRPYARFMPNVAVAEKNGRNPLYSFSTKGLAPSALNEVGNPYSDKQALLDKINAVPNPYYGYADYYESNRLDTRVKITNLPKRATVTIYSLDGTLIKRLEKDNPNQSFLEWDIRNNVGLPIASGMYLIHVKADGIGETVLKWFGAMRPLDITTY